MPERTSESDRPTRAPCPPPGSHRASATASAMASGLLLSLFLPCLTVAEVLADDWLPGKQERHRTRESAVLDPTALGMALSTPSLPTPLLKTPDDSASDYPLQPFHGYLQESWITDVGVLLYGDRDQDGHYTGLSISVDADTRWAHTDVYLTLTLRPYHGTTEELHTSAVFPLYGQSMADEYRIDIELIRDYPSNHHDLTIELRDAWDGRTLDHVGAAGFSNLRALPLESEDQDEAVFIPDLPGPAPIPGNDDVRVEEHAGSLATPFAMILTLLMLYRRRVGRGRVRRT